MGWVEENLKDEFKPPFPRGGGAKEGRKPLQELLACVMREGIRE